MTHRHGRHGWHGFGGAWMFAPPWAAKSGWGPGPQWGGFPGGRGTARRARRGDVRAAILAVLAEQPANGYQIIQEIDERSRGGWKPSPGSIYPTLSQLEDEGLVRAADDAGRRVFELTDAGHEYVASHQDDVSAPWEPFAAPDDDDDELRPLLAQTAAALWQVMGTGTPEQQARAREVLAETRRKLYGILADGDDDTRG